MTQTSLHVPHRDKKQYVSVEQILDYAIGLSGTERGPSPRQAIDDAAHALAVHKGAASFAGAMAHQEVSRIRDANGADEATLDHLKAALRMQREQAQAEASPA